MHNYFLFFPALPGFTGQGGEIAGRAARMGYRTDPKDKILMDILAGRISAATSFCISAITTGGRATTEALFFTQFYLL